MRSTFRFTHLVAGLVLAATAQAGLAQGVLKVRAVRRPEDA